MKGIEEREEAEIATFTPEELREYEDSLKAYRDLKNSLDTAEEKGRVEGREEGRVEEKNAIARNLKSMGMSISDISKATGLQEEEIKELWIYCNPSFGSNFEPQSLRVFILLYKQKSLFLFISVV